MHPESFKNIFIGRQINLSLGKASLRCENPLLISSIYKVISYGFLFTLLNDSIIEIHVYSFQ